MISRLSEQCEKLNITIIPTHSHFDWDSKMDVWNIEIQYKDKRYKETYNTGIGHRKLVFGVKKEQNGKYFLRNWGFITEKELIKSHSKPQDPTVADVLHCFLNDARSGAEMFQEWCSEYGYDPKNLDAIQIYFRCQATYIGLRNMFGSKLMETLWNMEH